MATEQEILEARSMHVTEEIETIVKTVQKCIDGATHQNQENIFKQAYYTLMAAHSLMQVGAAIINCTEEDFDEDEDEDGEFYG